MAATTWRELLDKAHVSEQMCDHVAWVVFEKENRGVTLSDVHDLLPAIQTIDAFVTPGYEPTFGPYKSQAFRALFTILAQNKASLNPYTHEQVISGFNALIEPEAKDTPFCGHSSSVEWEPFAATTGIDSQKCELRIGPFRDYRNLCKKLDIMYHFSCLDDQAPLGTLHLNWGLTQDQRKRYESSKHIYDGILRKLSYLSNSAARNLEVKYTYEMHSPTVKGPLEKDRAKDEHFQDCSGAKDLSKQQVARLECKYFGAAEDGDMEMVKYTIPVFQRALDDVAAAKTLNADLDALLKTAGIFDSMGHLTFEVPSGHTQNYAAAAAQRIADGIATVGETQAAIDEVKAYESDFGIRPLEGGPASGRVIGYRPQVNEYLHAFVHQQEAQALPHILEATRALRAAYEQQVRENAHHYPHKNHSDDWAERARENKNKEQHER